MEIVTTKKHLRKICGTCKTFLHIDEIDEEIEVACDQLCKILDENEFICLQVTFSSENLMSFNIVANDAAVQGFLSNLMNTKFGKSKMSIRRQKDIIGVLKRCLQVEDLLELQFTQQEEIHSQSKVENNHED